PPVTHYTKAFELLKYKNSEASMKKFMGIKQCIEEHTLMLNYLSKFMKAYKESPKISLIWATWLAHEDNDLLFHADNQLFNYFREHKKTLDKSYVFLMGDHGRRWGNIRKTSIGQLEVNNPMMFVSVPRHLR
ncbi:hypothetical protein PENTCL1PPCAC_25114, partial [Pristionchus entomophagus]